MGVLKFRIHPRERVNELPELRNAYMTGMDRTPTRASIDIRPGLLICEREHIESGRLHVAWPVREFGTPIVSTATLAERAQPYDLGVELARGRLNDVRNQLSEWSLIGLVVPEPLKELLRKAQKALARAVTAGDDREAAHEAANECLTTAFRAAEVLLQAYTDQVLMRRREHTRLLPTLLSTSIAGDPKKFSHCARLAEGINALRINASWGELAPTEGQLRWNAFDAQLAWCRANKLVPTAGPLIDLRPRALPDWLWLWSGDGEEIIAMAEDLIRQVLARYRGKVAAWHLVHRAAVNEILGLGEEDQVRLTARALQVARQVDPSALLIIDFERPWADWLASSPFQLGSYHLADSLSRADLGLGGIGLEVAIGYGPPGSHMRDILELSRLLDQFAPLEAPIHVTLAMPSAAGPDPQADPGVTVAKSQWPSEPDAALQRDRGAQWLALALAKPYVRSVHWINTRDADPHVYPHSGLFDANDRPKPLLDWMKGFRKTYLEPELD